MRYNLGVSRGYRSFAAAPPVLSKTLARRGDPRSRFAFKPSAGVKDKPSRVLCARRARKGRPKTGRDGRTRGGLGDQRVDVGGRYARYPQPQRDRRRALLAGPRPDRLRSPTASRTARRSMSEPSSASDRRPMPPMPRKPPQFGGVFLCLLRALRLSDAATRLQDIRGMKEH